MNPPYAKSSRPGPGLAFPLGAAIGLGAVLLILGRAVPERSPFDFLARSPLIADLLSFVGSGLSHDPLLVFIGAGLFAGFTAVSAAARHKGLPTGRLLALFKSAGFSTALALVAAKLPRILTEEFTAAAGIAPVYQTLGWITFAVAGACILELARETLHLLRAEAVIES